MDTPKSGENRENQVIRLCLWEQFPFQSAYTLWLVISPQATAFSSARVIKASASN